MNRIKEEIRFALPTREQAITLANDMVNGPGLVQKIHIGMSEEPVCWIVNEPKKPLTDAQVNELIGPLFVGFSDCAGDDREMRLARAIERAHGINSDE